MQLLKSQVVELYEIIISEGYTPNDFTQDIVHETISDGKCFKLMFESNKGYYFRFESSIDNESYHISIYSPGFKEVKSISYDQTWKSQLSSFVMWLECIKKEEMADDKLKRLLTYEPMMGVSENVSDDHFTVSEFDKLSEQVNSLKESSKKLNLEPAQIKQLHDKVDQVLEHAKTLSKTNWYEMFIGSVMGVVVNAGLESDVARELFKLIQETFKAGIILLNQ